MIHYTQRTLRILYGIRREMIGERPAVTDRLEIRFLRFCVISNAKTRVEQPAYSACYTVGNAASFIHMVVLNKIPETRKRKVVTALNSRGNAKNSLFS